MTGIVSGALLLEHVVIDASVAIKWFIPEEDSDRAQRLLDVHLFAPDILLVEVANYLRTQVGRAKMSSQDGTDILADLHQAPITFHPDSQLAAPAYAYGVSVMHPVYDCLYYALAQKLNCYVITADRRFITAMNRDQAMQHRVLSLDMIDP